MLKYTEVKLKTLVVHQVGNKLKEEGFKLSKSSMEINPEIQSLMLTYFLSPFKNTEYYHLNHSTDLNLNELYSYTSRIFSDPDSFFLQSVNIAKHLYDQSSHPKIRGGEFYLVYLQGCDVDGEITDAIGLFKSETRETFLKVYPAGDNFEIEYEDGININKLDKGCLIFNCESEKGFKVCIVDNLNKSGEAQYWKDDFLQVKPREDSFFHTENYMKLCQDFVKEELKNKFELNKVDEIDLLNRSASYFKQKESFDLNEFTNDVMQQPEVIDSFREFKKQYQEDREINVADEFEISLSAVKKQARIYKSILKLDKSFHVYIHGNRDRISKGFDEETGLNYYQLFFKEES